jgi:hypothetical protein
MKKKTFYALMDSAGMYIHTGFNATSKKELREALIELLEPQVDEDISDRPLEDLLFIEGLTIDEDSTPFPSPFEYDEMDNPI